MDTKFPTSDELKNISNEITEAVSNFQNEVERIASEMSEELADLKE